MTSSRREHLRRWQKAVESEPARDGLLVIDKAAGPTSHDVVVRARRAFGTAAVGHLGTLDPSATGLLLLAMGAATRCIAVLQGGDKTYEATLRLGITTTSQDLDGEVIETRTPAVTEAEIREKSENFVGAIAQVPPMVSALKHRGERLHAIARRGETVERAPRTVYVRRWEWLSFSLPEARFSVRCSGGTYVRTLVHDLGQALGCGAALVSLRRLRSEPFDLQRSVSSEAIETQSAAALWDAAGIPLEDAIRHLPSVSLTAEETEDIGHGRSPRIGVERTLFRRPVVGRVVLRDPAGHALALGEIDTADAPDREDVVTLRPRVVFPWAVREGRS
jgi:tRNA pseudouridine55 synthase